MLWVLGWDQYHRRTRHEVCAHAVESKMGLVAGRVVRAILGHSLPFELEVDSIASHPFSLTAIFNDLKENMKEYSIDLATLKKILELLRLDAMGAIDVDKSASSTHSFSSMHDGSPSYTVNMRNIIKTIKNEFVRSSAEHKYGKFGARIVQLLLRKVQVEQTKLSELVILPGKDTRSKLYELFRSKWIDYLEVTKRSDLSQGGGGGKDTPSSGQAKADGSGASTGGGHNNVYYFWTLNESKLHQVVLSEQYKAVHNVRLRRQHEFALGKDLVEFSHRITDMEEASRFDMLTNTLDALDCSMSRILKHIVVFEM